jgi:hypothetical protein
LEVAKEAVKIEADARVELPDLFLENVATEEQQIQAKYDSEMEKLFEIATISEYMIKAN